MDDKTPNKNSIGYKMGQLTFVVLTSCLLALLLGLTIKTLCIMF